MKFQKVMEKVVILPGGNVIAFLGILTITLTVTGHNVLHMPPVLGMMFGLGMLGTYGYFLKTRFPDKNKFDIFVITGRAEWDTLLFIFLWNISSRGWSSHSWIFTTNIWSLCMKHLVLLMLMF